MNKLVLNFAVIAFTFMGLVACKGNGNETTTSEEQDVAEATTEATEYTVNTEKSVIKWVGAKPTGSHNGTVKLSSGTLSANDREIQAGNFTIDMNSITDLDLEGEKKANLEAHLKGTAEGKEGDFFNVTKYPTATFELTDVSGEGGDVTVRGNLTIKDVTHNIEFPAVVSFPGDDVFLKSKPFSIDRTKWNVNYGSKSVFDNLGDQFINDEVELVIELHGSK
ncbi:YceI family protein [Altibacter sp.]|uniref:YceI family protein n=1 Tax=Altibacter sp. TaxID=2024823 RepID=UPI002584A70E|nr:YceI family protein [Altibacter sp.]MCW8982053.1 YceI family protein [Altibacter sp.]MCW9038666.1 YceI family protein [Altibacter sp.]